MEKRLPSGQFLNNGFQLSQNQIGPQSLAAGSDLGFLEPVDQPANAGIDRDFQISGVVRPELLHRLTEEPSESNGILNCWDRSTRFKERYLRAGLLAQDQTKVALSQPYFLATAAEIIFREMPVHGNFCHYHPRIEATDAYQKAGELSNFANIHHMKLNPKSLTIGAHSLKCRELPPDESAKNAVFSLINAQFQKLH
jgi:hypothetical protein